MQDNTAPTSIISRDRTRRRRILRATTPLPRRLRIRLRKNLLAGLQRQMARNADVLFVRHPKTGGTWLRALLTSLYGQKYGLSTRRVVRSDELHLQHAGLPKLLISSGYFSWERWLGEAVLRDPSLSQKRLLILARHPGDVVVSWYIQFTRRTKAFKRELLLAEMSQPFDPASVTLEEFVQHEEAGLPSIIAQYNYWAERLPLFERHLVMRYEDLRTNTVDSLGKLATFLGESFTDTQIEQAAEFGSVDNLRKLERDGYFDNRSLRLRDATDTSLLKVRRAQIGGFRDDLPASIANRVAKQVADSMHPVYGYTG